MMPTYFVCNVTETGYSHREFESYEEATAACVEGSYLITVDNGQITNAPFDAPGPAIRAIRFALKRRHALAPAPVRTTTCDVCGALVKVSEATCPSCGALFDGDLAKFVAQGAS